MVNFKYIYSSIVGDPRSISMEMTQNDTNKTYTRGAQRLNVKNSSNMGNSSMFINNRSSIGNKTRGSDD